jgi:hypothetical protein
MYNVYTYKCMVLANPSHVSCGAGSRIISALLDIGIEVACIGKFWVGQNHIFTRIYGEHTVI